MTLAAALRWAKSRFRAQAPRFLLLLLGWAGVCVVLEVLVVLGGSPPGHPLWVALHLGYFWGTAYWEAALARAALEAADEAAASPLGALLDHRVAFRMFALKMLLCPCSCWGWAAVLGLGLLITVPITLLAAARIFRSIDR